MTGFFFLRLKYIVVATDISLSNWGEAKEDNSYAGWACKYKDLKEVLAYVQNRSDMQRVRIVSSKYRPSSRYCSYLRIYVYKNKDNKI